MISESIEKHVAEVERLFNAGRWPTDYVHEQGPTSFGHWRRAAEQGDVGAQLLSGLCLIFGAGAPENAKEGIDWLQGALNRGQLHAGLMLGCFLQKSVPGGEGVGGQVLQLVAEHGLAPAQFVLGEAYEQGLGVNKNPLHAAKWYTKAGEQGFRAAVRRLAKAYVQGDLVPVDDREAFRWIRELAEGGDADAQYCLGRMYVEGRGGPMNAQSGIHWFDKVVSNLSAEPMEVERAMQARIEVML